MKNLRLVQITDIHLLKDENAELYGVDTADTLRRVVKVIANLEPAVDCVIATGDLAEDGKAETYQRLKHLLEPLDKQVYCLPGNHDDISEMQNELNDNNIHFVGKHQQDDWGFIFLNSQVMEQSHGFINAAEMQRLEAELVRMDNLNVIIALHHTPIDSCGSTGCHLHNVDEFRDLISNFSNVKAVVAGHTHNPDENRLNHFCEYTTPSTFAHVTHTPAGQSDSPDDFWSCHKMDNTKQGFRILDLGQDGSIQSEVVWVNTPD